MSAPEFAEGVAATLRVGQRVRVTRVVEGVVGEVLQHAFGVTTDAGRSWWFTDRPAIAGDLTVEVLAEPRPPEPTGLGAVVEARLARDRLPRRHRFLAVPSPNGTTKWALVVAGHSPTGECVTRSEPANPCTWDELADPVVLSEGWGAEQ